jgi:hypothetical protein
MKMRLLVGTIGACLLSWTAAVAQQNPGNIAALEFQKPKNGMVKQYEDARKQKAAWHLQQKDSQPLMVWQILTGEGTGTYIVGRTGQHWADLDKPSIPDQADLDEYNKVVSPYVESMQARYYQYLPKVSNMNIAGAPEKYTEVVVFQVRYGHEADFMSGITRVTEAAQKTKWPVQYGWFTLFNGGQGGEYVLIIPHKNWAAFEDNPNVKPFQDMLKDAFGQEESDSIMNRFNSSVEKQYNEIDEFRADLSYIPK